MHHCHFCKDRLIPDVCRWYERPLLIVLVRPYYCPHCFEGFYRPVLSMRELMGYPPKRSELVQATTNLRSNSPAPTRSASGEPRANRTRPKKSKAYKRSAGKGLASSFFKARGKSTTRSKSRGKATEKPKPLKKHGFGRRLAGAGDASKPIRKSGFGRKATINPPGKFASYNGSGPLTSALNFVTRIIRRARQLLPGAGKASGMSRRSYR